jgi:hypothetical protein
MPGGTSGGGASGGLPGGISGSPARAGVFAYIDMADLLISIYSGSVNPIMIAFHYRLWRAAE